MFIPETWKHLMQNKQAFYDLQELYIFLRGKKIMKLNIFKILMKFCIQYYHEKYSVSVYWI